MMGVTRTRVRDDNDIPQVIAAIEVGIVSGLKILDMETRQAIQRGFDRGTDAMGNEWAPLSPVTIAMQEPSANADRILIDTEAMRNSFDSEIEPGKNRLTIGNDDEKLAYHEFGTEKIPPRPVMGPGAEYAEKRAFESFEAAVMDHVITAAGI